MQINTWPANQAYWSTVTCVFVVGEGAEVVCDGPVLLGAGGFEDKEPVGLGAVAPPELVGAMVCSATWVASLAALVGPLFRCVTLAMVARLAGLNGCLSVI